MRPLRLESDSIESFDGTRLAVQATGAGPVFLLANGLGGTAAAWRHLITHLQDRYRVVSWDYRGLYGSGPPASPDAIRPEHHREDLRCVLDWTGEDSAVLAGWSMGVQVILDFTLTHPERVDALVPICGAPGDTFRTALYTEHSRWAIPLLARTLEALRQPLSLFARAVTSVPFAPEVLRTIGLVGPSCDLEVFRDLARDYGTLDFGLYLRILRTLGDHSTWERLHTITSPTLVFGAGRDVMTPLHVSERMTELIPGAELHSLAEGTHYAPLEFPEEINEALDRFLAEKVPLRPGRAATGSDGGDLEGGSASPSS